MPAPTCGPQLGPTKQQGLMPITVRHRCDQQAEALKFPLGGPEQLSESGLWLALAVVPEYLRIDGPMITSAAAQQFRRDWHHA